jgi:circadian clock protein KaiC
LNGICKELIDQGRLFILDASPDPEGQEIVGEFDLSALIERIQYAVIKYRAKRVSIDSITAIFQQYDSSRADSPRDFQAW